MDARLHVDEHVLAPEAIDDLGAGDELAPPLDEQDEQIHRVALESNGAALAAELVRRDVELEVAKAKPLAWIGDQLLSRTRSAGLNACMFLRLQLQTKARRSAAVLHGQPLCAHRA